MGSIKKRENPFAPPRPIRSNPGAPPPPIRPGPPEGVVAGHEQGEAPLSGPASTGCSRGPQFTRRSALHGTLWSNACTPTSFFDPWLASPRLSDRGVTCREKSIGRGNGPVGLGTGETLNITFGARFSPSRLTSPAFLSSLGLSAFAPSPCVCLLTNRSLPICLLAEVTLASLLSFNSSFYFSEGV